MTERKGKKMDYDQQVYQEGFDAFLQGANEESCPYMDVDFDKWSVWMDGFEDAESHNSLGIDEE